MTIAGIKQILLLIFFLISFSLLKADDSYLIKGETREVSIYQIDKTSPFIILNMGYASAIIQNAEIWDNKNKQIFEVDIVFTAYPKNKEQWLTKYDYLLKERIKSVQTLEPSLKEHKEIKWN